ncbi:MAG: radical SAM protein [Gammaproteobacteria bacterium HGW-Gammaproteobacteria-3]|nr:MAG: radical SAM protein [Gammaproteobacteria bacterium HGW-Gammaproteobacteria-3]
MATSATLTTSDHNRNAAGLKYIYPVISRRAGGLSIGVNFNVNNACNWRCLYCQVPGLQLGAPPAMDFQLLERELRLFLTDVLQGDFYDRFQFDQEHRVIKDIAISGNGEPTSLSDFDRAVELIGRIATELKVFPESHFVLISNGSLVHQAGVQAGLMTLKRYGGEVWFKFDSATEVGRKLINNTAQSLVRAKENLLLSARLCPTKIQTCLVDYCGQGLSAIERDAYVRFLAQLKPKTNIRKVMLYTLARPSCQPEAGQIKPLPVEVMTHLADAVRALGFDVSVSV